jgi:hypothetical protein
MKKRLTYEQKRDQSLKDIINKMFELAELDVTFDDILGRTDDWFTQYTMTEDQYDQWKQWGGKYLMKQLKLTEKKADYEMSMVGLMYGLKFVKNQLK